MPYSSSEKRRENDRKRRLLDPAFREKRIIKGREYRKSAAGIACSQRYWRANKKRLTAQMIARARADQPKENARINEWRRRQGPSYWAAIRARDKARKKTDIQYSMKLRLRDRINAAIRHQGLKEKAAGTMELTGCTRPELISHIQSLFLPGMTWENRRTWHIDHDRPCCTFDLSDPIQQRKCFNYKNLKPMWPLDNMRKGSKWLPPAQAAA